MSKVVPSILDADWGAFREEICRLEEEGCDLVHLDIMDGHFVPNITLGPSVLDHLTQGTKVRFEVHLMVEKPEIWVHPYATDRTETILVHPEGVPHVHRVLEQISDLGIKPGLVLNPGTPLQAIDWVSDTMRQLLLMTVNPGFGGQKFIKSLLPKISQARERLRELGIDDKCPIQVDGGVNAKTAPLALQAGARYFVIGASIFRSEDPRASYREFVKIVSPPRQ